MERLGNEEIIEILGLGLLAFPLLAFLLLGLAALSKKSISTSNSIAPALAVFFQGTSLLFSILQFSRIWGQQPTIVSYPWLQVGDEFSVSASFLFNAESGFMALLVNLVAFLVVVYSIGYLSKDKQKEKYFSFLAFFVLAMNGLVLAGNLLVVFFFWELIGLASYLLIGFWNTKLEAPKASLKAILVNKIGDVALLLAIASAYNRFGTLELIELQAIVGPDPYKLCSCFYVIGFGLAIAAMAKSAQVPLSVWLGDAMAGPTPVSALMHAATMVAAGVYLLARTYVLFNFTLLTFLAIIGAMTALMGALSALQQTDLKKLLAYSTISQLGYMVMGMGIGAYEASLFHLLTHAFFKAALFLCAGVIIHHMSTLKKQVREEGFPANVDPQDIRLMGGFRHSFPLLFACYSVAAASLAGLPLLSGFLSKDALLLGAMAWAGELSNQGLVVAWIVPTTAFLTVFLTAAYVMKHWLSVFFGELRLPTLIKKQLEFAGAKSGAENLHLKAPSETKQLLELAPIIILSLGSLAFVYSINPFDGSKGWFMSNITMPIGSYAKNFNLHLGAEDYHLHIYLLSIGLAVLGLLFSYRKYRPNPSFEDLIYRRGSLSNLLYHHFYANALMIGLPVRIGSAFQKIAQQLEVRVLERITRSLTVSHAILAYLTAFFDRYIVDGLVKTSALLLRTLGYYFVNLFRAGFQGYLVLLGILLLALYFLW